MPIYQHIEYMYTTFQVSREREKAVTTSIQIEQSLKDLEKVSLHAITVYVLCLVVEVVEEGLQPLAG